MIFLGKAEKDWPKEQRSIIFEGQKGSCQEVEDWTTGHVPQSVPNSQGHRLLNLKSLGEVGRGLGLRTGSLLCASLSTSKNANPS